MTNAAPTLAQIESLAAVAAAEARAVFEIWDASRRADIVGGCQFASHNLAVANRKLARAYQGQR